MRASVAWGASPQQPVCRARRQPVHAAVPQRLLHRRRPGHATGRRVDFPPGAFPASAGGQAFDPTAWEGNDGFSPGSTILTHVPGLSLGASHVATISDMGASLAPTSPVVLVDARTGARWPTWAELDAKDPNPATQLLIIHPARNLTEGDRYIVALRDLKAARRVGHRAVARVRIRPRLAARRRPASRPYAAHLRSVVAQLRKDGVGTAGLFLAWDFTVASTRNITQPALTMRDQTFAALGKGVGPFTVTKEVVDPPGQPDLARVVTGTFAVPSYLRDRRARPGRCSTWRPTACRCTGRARSTRPTSSARSPRRRRRRTRPRSGSTATACSVRPTR